jgi:hypothetical protein
VTDLARSSDSSPAERLDALAVTAGEYLVASESEATRRSYASDWRAFTRWCIDHDVEPFPAEPLRSGMPALRD